MLTLISIIKSCRCLGVTLCMAFLCLSALEGRAQIQSVTSVRQLAFGAFTQGSSGGTVTVSNDGSRSATGTVIPLNLGISYYQAVFEVEAPVGTIISIMNGPEATLTGSNGGTMSLHIGASSPAAPFVITTTPPQRTQVSIGGTLTVGNATASPPGSYAGTFYITFNNE